MYNMLPRDPIAGSNAEKGADPVICQIRRPTSRRLVGECNTGEQYLHVQHGMNLSFEKA